jgi:serine/threonine protein kinase
MFRHLKGNILVNYGGQPCIDDIGVDILAVREIYKGFSRVSGAWSYKAPEELTSGVRDQRTDVYSFACIIYAVSGFLDLPYN